MVFIDPVLADSEYMESLESQDPQGLTPFDEIMIKLQVSPNDTTLRSQAIIEGAKMYPENISLQFKAITEKWKLNFEKSLKRILDDVDKEIESFQEIQRSKKDLREKIKEFESIKEQITRNAYSWDLAFIIY